MFLKMMPRVLVALVLLPGVSRSADLTGYVGAVMPGKLAYGNLTDAGLERSPIYGVRLGWNFVPMLGMEHTFAFSSDYLFPRNLLITESKGFVYNGNLIVSIPLGHTVPYATAGLGLIHQYGSPGEPVGTKFAVNYGGGLKLPGLWGPFGLRFDARGYTATGILSTRLNMFEVSGGVLLSFGR